MCTWGIDIATQHATPAVQSSRSSAPPGMPSGRGEVVAPPETATGAATGWAGGRRRSESASGSMLARQNTPMPR